MGINTVFDLIFEQIQVIKNHLIALVWKKPDEWSKGENTVLLVPGYGGNHIFFEKLAVFLNQNNYKIELFGGFKKTEKIMLQAEKLAKQIEENNYANLVIIAHSRGGLIAKQMINTHPELLIKISKIICFSTPWQGTWLGYLRINNLSEMIPGDKRLKEISENKTGKEKMICFYPKTDDRVIPNKNLILKDVENIRIEVNGHSQILDSSLMLKKLGNILRIDL